MLSSITLFIKAAETHIIDLVGLVAIAVLTCQKPYGAVEADLSPAAAWSDTGQAAFVPASP